MITKQKKTFYLTEICVELWDYDYKVEADTLEEAKAMIKKGGLDPYNSIQHTSETKDIIETND